MQAEGRPLGCKARARMAARTATSAASMMALGRAAGPLNDIVDSVIASRSAEDDTAVVAVRRHLSANEEEPPSPR